MTCELVYSTSDMAPHLMQSFEQLRDVLLLCDGSVLPLHLSQLLLLSSDDFEAAEETILCYGGATCRAQHAGVTSWPLCKGLHFYSRQTQPDATSKQSVSFIRLTADSALPLHPGLCTNKL